MCIRDSLKAVHGAWKQHYDEVRRALRDAYYQGWDLHPSQLATPHAAVVAFFLEGRAEAAEPPRRVVEKAAQATPLGTRHLHTTPSPRSRTRFRRARPCRGRAVRLCRLSGGWRRLVRRTPEEQPHQGHAQRKDDQRHSNAEGGVRRLWHARSARDRRA